MRSLCIRLEKDFLLCLCIRLCRLALGSLCRSCFRFLLNMASYHEFRAAQNTL
ncbi:DUF1289 domain-containing protein [Campylobacter rectus]|nr:DUF1289 domain-containing protein [Campylobacter rectus]